MTDQTMTPADDQSGAGGALPDYSKVADSFFNGGAQQQQSIQVRNNLMSASGLNPAQEARYQLLAKQTNTPVDSVRGNVDAVHAQAQMDAMDTDRLVAQYPKTSGYLSNQNNANVAHNDVHTLTGIEDVTGDGWWKQNANALPSTPYELLKGFAGSFNKLMGSAATVTGAAPVALDRAISAVTGKYTSGAEDWWFNSFAAPWIQNQPYFTPDAKAPSVLKATNAVGGTLGALVQIMAAGPEAGAAEVGAAAPAAELTAGEMTANAVTHATKAMAPVAVSDAVDTGRQVYQATGDATQALNAAQTQYITSTLGGVVPLSAGGGLLARFATGAAAGLVTGEASRQLMNTALPLDMQQGFDPEQAVIGMLTGGILAGGGGHGEPAFHDQVRDVYATAIKAGEAETNLQRIKTLSELSQQSELRKNSPAAFKEFVESAAEQGGMPEVYVDGKTLDNVLNQSGIDRNQLADTMPEVASQMREATQSDGYVRIPIADYATHIAGSPVEEALMPHLKTDPNGMTFAESQEFYQRHAKELQDQAQRIVDDANQSEQAKADVQAIHDDILQKLNAANVYSGDVNKVNAALARDFYVTMADRAGMAPGEFYEAHPLNIEGLMRAGKGVLNQEPGGLSKVVSDIESGGLKMDAYERNGVITLSRIVVPEESRNQGAGTAAMQKLMDYADSTGQRIALTPSSDFGGSKKRLTEFYGRLGFKANKGGARDFSIMEGMVREPLEPARDEGSRQYRQSETDGVAPGGEPGVDFRHGQEILESRLEQWRSSLASDGRGGIGLVEQKWAEPSRYAGERGSSGFVAQAKEGRAEQERLIAAAKEHGFFLDDSNPFFEAVTAHKNQGGFEHDAFIVGDPQNRVVIRSTIKGSFGNTSSYSPVQYLKRLKEYNQLFPDLQVRVIGVGEREDGTAAIWTAQKFVHGEEFETQADLDAAMRSHGWFEVGTNSHKYQNKDTGAVIEDVHPGNVLHIGDQLFPIDVIVDKLPKGSLLQDKRGSYSPDTATISLGKASDLSTFPHELAHHFLELSTELANQEHGPAAVKSDMDSLLRWFGEKGETPEERLANWNARSLEEKRDGHEKFAEGFETYLMEGKAPTVELQPLFARLRSWMLAVYKSLSNMGVQLNDEVRGVFDRMLASQEAITRAEQVRGYESLFSTAEDAGLTDKQFADYQALGQKATDDAISEMTGRTMRDMKWLSGAKSKALRDLQREAATQRKGIREEVSKEVEAMPVNRAREWLSKGRMVDEHGTEIQVADEARKGAKLNADDVARMNPAGELGAADLSPLRGMTSKEGLHPDLVAEMFGYPSGKELIGDLLTAPKAKDQIADMTDQRMLERHGELTNPVAMERAAEEAIHNEARAKFMATGLKILTKSQLPASQIAKAAKEAAETAIAAKKVGELRPLQYTAAEARANREALKLVPKEPAKAATAQRSALLNNRLARAAADAVTDIQKGLRYLKRFDKGSTRDNIDQDHLDQIDALLSRFDLKQVPSKGPTRQQVSLQSWIDSQRMAGYDPVMRDDLVDPTLRTHYKDLSVEQFRGLVDAVKSIEHIGREQKSISIAGKKVAVEELVRTEFVPKMQARGDKFTDEALAYPARAGVDSPMKVALERVSSWLRSTEAEFKGQQFKANQFDLHEVLGPFRQYLFDRIFDANYRKLDMLKGLADDVRQRVDADLGKDWQKSLTEQVPNKILMDNRLENPIPRRMTRGEMLGIARHVGNESNFDKLVRGMGWDPADVWRFLHENMTEKDWKATQLTWDVAGKHWEDMAAMSRRLGNRMPAKVEARPFQTQFGEMRGGYAPVDYDPEYSRIGTKKSDASAINPAEELFNASYFRSSTTTNGSMKERSNYADFIDLDYHSVERRIHDTIHDLAYREALIDAHKIIAHPEFRQQFKRTYGPEQYKSMQTWLGRIANSGNTDEMSSRLARIMSSTRRALVANGIAFRVSTMLKHGGSAGLKTMGYFSGGAEKYVLARMAAIGTNHAEEVRGALEKFSEIRARALQQDRDYRQVAASIFEPESIHGKAERFGHSGVAFLDFLTAVPTAWAAYDRAITEGIPENRGGTGQPMTEEQAVAYANSIVREAHGTNIETGRSLLMSNPSELVKTLTMLHGFMNNTLGQQLDMVDKFRQGGFSKPEVLSRYMMAMIVPALWTGLLAGEFEDKNGDGWWKGVVKAITGEYAACVPLVRDAYHAAEGFNSAGMPPWMAAISAATAPVRDVAQAVQGKKVAHPIKDAGNAAGLLIPGLGQLGTTLQYLSDVMTGDQHPQNAVEVAQGLAFGSRKHH